MMALLDLRFYKKTVFGISVMLPDSAMLILVRIICVKG